MKTYIMALGLILGIVAADVVRADEAKPSDSLDESKLNYPELEVTPRASERLEIEAKNERNARWGTHIPIQFSALATVYASSSVTYKDGASAQEKDDYTSAKNMAFGVGAGWLALTGVLSALYTPYYSGLKEISKLPAKTQREQLTRERLAEEALYAPASLAWKLKWFSVATNFWANAQLLRNADPDSRITIGLGVVASLAPLLFDYRWSQVATQHREYKKKIYGPLAGMILLPVEGGSPSQSKGSRLQPGFGLSWVF